MPRLADYLEKVDFQDKKFVGTIAFRNEELTLPDGNKAALGIDDGHWVLVYQEKPGNTFQVFEFDQPKKMIFVDKKPGGEKEIKLFMRLLEYFFSHVRTDDLVTLLPPKI